MKKLLVTGVIALVVVGGTGLYVLKVLGDVGARYKELEAEFQVRAKALRETDAMFPYAGGGHLDAVRFPTWIEVRTNVARAFAARLQERPTAFHSRETSNDMVDLLKKELIEKKMSFAEYQATDLRWRALLGLPEFQELQKTWREGTATRKDPEGLPLPPPALDAQEKELEQIRRYAGQLAETVEVDALGPMLDRIKAGK